MHKLTISAEKHIKEKDFVKAVDDKLKIAQILRKQGLERDKYLTEEGIRAIFEMAGTEARAHIYNRLTNYNLDMAKSLLHKIR